MIYDYTVVKEAYAFIENGKKTVEIREDNKKKPDAGDFLCFHEQGGDRTIYALVEKVVVYAGIEELKSDIDKTFWAFEPDELLNEIISREFCENNQGCKVKAIFFQLVDVSIIMPGYNVQSFVKETLNCIENQTYKKFQLFFLDDCSSDETIEIVQSFSVKFPIECIKNQTHKGAANLRNIGIERATGSYIVFWDSDDLFEADYLQKMVQALKCSQADIAIAEYDSFESEKGYNGCTDMAIVPEFLYDNENKLFTWKDMPYYMNYLTNVPWNKMYRKDFLVATGARFQELPCSNDVFFSHYTMCKGKLIHIDSIKAMIHYRIGRKNSISDKHNYFSEIEAYQKILNCTKDLDEEIRSNIYMDFLIGVMKCIRWGSGSAGRQFFEYVKNDILKCHELIPYEYLINNHPWLIDIFEKCEYGHSIYKVNYSLIYAVERNKDCIRDFLFNKRCEKKIGIMRLNNDTQYLINYFDIELKNIVIGDECGMNRPDIILCCSLLQLTELEAFRKKNNIESIQVVLIYDMKKSL